MAWDLSFKRSLKRVFEQHGFTVQAGVELANARVYLDFVIRGIRANTAYTDQHPFKYGNDLVIGEFKSNRDKLSTADFYHLIGKYYFYWSLSHGYGKRKPQHPVWHHHASCALVLGGRLRIPTTVHQQFQFRELEPGIYQAQAKELPLFHVILIDKVVHYPLFRFAGLFGSEPILEQTLEYAIDTDNTFIKSIGYILYKDKVVSMAASKGKPIDPISLSIRDAVETIGISRVVEEVGLKRVVEEVGLKRVIEEVGLKRVIKEIDRDSLIAILLEEEPETLKELKQKLNQLKL